MCSGTPAISSVLADLPAQVRLGQPAGCEQAWPEQSLPDLPSGQLAKSSRCRKLSHLAPSYTLCCSQAWNSGVPR